MPHSSGGGSHGGGSHGGSHSSGSHGGSGTSRRHASSYFNGARHYVYYKNRKPVHFYSDVEITPEYIKHRKRVWTAVRVILACFYLLLFLTTSITWGIAMPRKLSQPCADPNRIVDTVSMISASEEAAIMEQIDEFREKTGISVTILTVYDEVWEKNFTSLENYAFDYYLANLSDEKNWLLVYSEPVFHRNFKDWKWEGMQGDDTDRILTSTATDRFTEEMQKNITRDGFGKAVAETFDSFNDDVMNTSVNWIALGATLLGLSIHGSIFYLVFWLVMGANIKTDEQAIELADPQAVYQEDTCSYCDGLYIHGIHTSCPHCGAPLTPLEKR